MSGAVVHARQGQRNRYRPIATSLCGDAAPHAVIAALLDLHSFETIYIADLDALMGTGDHRELLECLQGDYPRVKFWIDRGLPEPGAMGHGTNCVPVIGSESLAAADWSALKARRGEFILSLDFMEERLLGAQNLVEYPGFWPEKIIVMSLSRVGGNEGPDFQRLENFRAAWPDKSFIAAGGVRSEDDLKRLDGLGISGVLLASALHSGVLGSSVLRDYD